MSAYKRLALVGGPGTSDVHENLLASSAVGRPARSG